MSCCRCPHCGRTHVVDPVVGEQGGRCPCGARFWVEPWADADDGHPEAAGHVPDGARLVWWVEPDGTPRPVYFF